MKKNLIIKTCPIQTSMNIGLNSAVFENNWMKNATKGKSINIVRSILKGLLISTKTSPFSSFINPVNVQKAPFPMFHEMILKLLFFTFPIKDFSVTFDIRLSDSSVLLFSLSKVSVCPLISLNS
ncbi:hypothetical protein [Epilithonimonas sp.]|uniref:hypothetical protein n=1 Tax=Epilithonimonas sp. TaxID=2894511 RepID=UPI00289C9687|nr:hypothetical protein [Epilithonimonas sp.]